MKCNVKAFRALLVCFLVLAFHPSLSAFMQEPGGEPPAVPALGSDAKPIPTAGGMPGWPVPDKPIPHHEPGHLSRADSYRTEVERPNELGMLEMVEVTGADAMAADGVDPLAGNYTLVNWDTVFWSSSYGDQFNVKTLKVDPAVDAGAINTIPGSEKNLGPYPRNDIAAADLNNDGQTEQIVAWIGEGERVHVSIGEMPGSLGRATSKPAVVVHDDGSIDLLVRGYDDALWHRRYVAGSWGDWNNDGGGFLLSAPAIASQGDSQFDVFVIGTDNQVHRRHWDGLSWSSMWTQAGESDDWTSLAPWFGPTPELPAPAAVARGTRIDLFRLGPDNTLRWHNGTGWQSLGGMLASGPAVVSLNENHMRVLARGVDEALWHLTYTSASWGPWSRHELYGVDDSVTIASPPTAVVSGSTIDVFVQGSDGQLWTTQCDSSGCGSWSLFGGPESLASGVAVAAGDWRYFALVETGALVHSSDGSAWQGFGGLTPWRLVHNTQLTARPRPSPCQDFSIRVEPGYLQGDGRTQIALGYFSGNNEVSVAVYETAEKFEPRLVTQLALPHTIDYFTMATGDYLKGDGKDEIAVAYVRGNMYDLALVEVTPEGLMEVASAGGETVTIPDEDCDDYEYASFTGTLDLASGDFDGDGQDEIALVTAWHQQDWMYTITCHSFIYSVRMRVYDVLQNVETEEYRVKAYYVGQDKCGAKGAWWGEALQKDWDPCVVGVAITAGDVDGDGQDELVRTWPERFDTYADSCWTTDGLVVFRFVRRLEVLQLPSNPGKHTNSWDTNNDGVISSLEIFHVDSRGEEKDWSPSFQDRLAVGDLNRDLKYEIIWLMSDQLRTFYHDPYAEQGARRFKPFTERAPLFGMTYPEIVAGNFTRESIRVGRPTYRVQNRVDTLLAVINMPPKHRDLIQDAEGNVQLIESPAGDCSPSPDSPDCTHAKYAKQDFRSSEQSIQTVHAYEISAGMENEACAGVGVGGIGEVKACARFSIDATHGGNFQHSTTELSSVAFRRKVIAASDDKVVYFGTPYGVWEYPVLSDASAETGDDVFITVAFPLVSATQYPDSSGGYLAGTCDETWFSAGHQPNNVWSYDPIGDISFPDYSPDYEPVYDAIEGDWAEGEITYQKLKSAFDSVTFKHSISARYETEVTAEAQLKVVNVSGSFKAHLQGDYSNSYMKTDKLTDIQDTAFSYFFAPQPDDAKFTTRVLFYRGKDDSQIMNYQTEPGRSASWQLYDKPDPAFILPWYGFPDPDDPQVPPCGEEQKLFSPDVVVDPPYAGVGDTVTLTARVRSFSNVPTENVSVRFYLGDPANGGSVIGQDTIPSLSRDAGPRTVSIAWQAQGLGEQKIFAVIDPEDTIPEMHDGGDLIDNNVAYGLFRLSSAAYADMGWAEVKPYDVISYTLAEPANVVSLHVPRASLSAVTRFELAEAVAAATAEALVGHTAFEVQAFQGSKFTMWDEPIEDFDLKPDAEDPPAIITVAYTDASVAGLEEANLTLYRFEGDSWQPATCPGYRTVLFPDDNLLAVPVCQTGVFALGTGEPQPLPGYLKYLPTICCDRCGWLSSSASQSLTTP